MGVANSATSPVIFANSLVIITNSLVIITNSLVIITTLSPVSSLVTADADVLSVLLAATPDTSG